MSVLVLSKGDSSESSYKPFEVRDVHTYTGSYCVGTMSKSKPADQLKTAVHNKHVTLERNITSLEITASKSRRSDELLPQISWMKSCSQPSLNRGILKNISGGKEKSLKTKQVSFADLKGKVLTQVKEIPKLSKFEQRIEEDLNPGLQEIPKQSIPPVSTLQRVATKNEWYYAKQDCMERLRSNKVSLQEVFLERATIKGKIRVVNISFEKSVIVHWTKDSWKNSIDTTAKYSEERGNTNHASDCFVFYLPCDSGCIEFAIQYTVGRRVYWDNNDGTNYQLRIS